MPGNDFRAYPDGAPHPGTGGAPDHYSTVLTVTGAEFADIKRINLRLNQLFPGGKTEENVERWNDEWLKGLRRILGGDIVDRLQEAPRPVFILVKRGSIPAEQRVEVREAPPKPTVDELGALKVELDALERGARRG